MWIDNMNAEEFQQWYAERKAEINKDKMRGHYKLQDDEEWVQLGYGYFARTKKKKKK